MHASLKYFIGLTLFTALNVLLVIHHGNAVPKRDFLIIGMRLIGLLIIAQFKQEGVVLEKTKRFLVLYALYSSLEVTFSILLPWWLLFRDSHNGYLMAPHLFVLQVQTALEPMMYMAGHNPHLTLWYMVIASTYRALALVTWVARMLGDDVDSMRGRPLLVTMLPGISVCLRIFSHLFIWFEWYPLLRSDETMTATKMKKKE